MCIRDRPGGVGLHGLGRRLGGPRESVGGAAGLRDDARRGAAGRVPARAAGRAGARAGRRRAGGRAARAGGETTAIAAAHRRREPGGDPRRRRAPVAAAERWLLRILLTRLIPLRRVPDPFLRGLRVRRVLVADERLDLAHGLVRRRCRRREREPVERKIPERLSRYQVAKEETEEANETGKDARGSDLSMVYSKKIK